MESTLQKLKDEAAVFIDPTQKGSTTVGISEETGEPSQGDATKEIVNTETAEGSTFYKNAEEAAGESSTQNPV